MLFEQRLVDREVGETCLQAGVCEHEDHNVGGDFWKNEVYKTCGNGIYVKNDVSSNICVLNELRIFNDFVLYVLLQLIQHKIVG